jgi:hypothetical protein
MQADLMVEYMKWFKKSLGHNDVVIVFLDRHKTHMTLELGKFCSENGIVLVALYPNSTRIIQPLDVGLFGGIKTKFKAEVDLWTREHPGESFDIADLAPTIKKVNDSVATPEAIRKSFERCGIYPWDEDKIDYGRCLGRSLPIGGSQATPAIEIEEQLVTEDNLVEEESANDDSGCSFLDTSTTSEQSQHVNNENDSNITIVLQNMMRDNEKQQILLQQLLNKVQSQNTQHEILKVPEAPKRTGTRTILKLPHVVTSAEHITGMEDIGKKKRDEEDRKNENKLKRLTNMKIKQEAAEERKQQQRKRAAQKIAEDAAEPAPKRGRGRPRKAKE